MPTDATSEIATRILSTRGQRAMLDSDLAAVYGVSTRRFNEQVRRNDVRFPGDFSFELTDQKVENLKSQFATSSWMAGAHGGRRKRPRVFTEYGAIMAASILNSPRAVQMSVYVVRAFVRLREVLASNTTLARRLETLARRLETLQRSVAALDSDTRKQFDEVYEAILGLMSPPSRKS